MKKVLSLLVLSMSALFIFSIGNPDSASAAAKQPVYRVYNPNSGEHLFTLSLNEVQWLSTIGWKDEGTAWYTSDNNFRPDVTRYLNPNSGDHHYAIDPDEISFIVNAGWVHESVQFLTAYPEDENAAPVYRLYNPNAVTGAHHFTLFSTERDNLIKAGWKDEGISWYSITK